MPVVEKIFSIFFNTALLLIAQLEIIYVSSAKILNVIIVCQKELLHCNRQNPKPFLYNFAMVDV
jgi:hypothetical protein